MDESKNSPPANLGTTKPCKTWFIERGDGFIFACDENEAWGLFNNRTNWMRKDFKIIGVSDGMEYFGIMANGQKEFATLLNEVAELKRILSRYLQAEDKFRFTDLLDESDERVKKAVKLRTETQDKLDEKEKLLANFRKALTDKAFNTELAKARGHIENPRNMDVICNENDRAIVFANMPRR